MLLGIEILHESEDNKQTPQYIIVMKERITDLGLYFHRQNNEM